MDFLLRTWVLIPEKTAAGLGCKAEQVLVCSTGVIGRHLPMPRIEDYALIGDLQTAARVERRCPLSR